MSAWPRRSTMWARSVVSVVAIATLAVAITGTNAAARGRAPDGVVVPTDSGPVRGLTTRTVDEFLGIPYAAPPVGDLRWRPPRPAARWHGLRDATYYAPHCPQHASAFGTASSSEDCLYLNIFRPAHRHHRLRDLPVMVWFHGGSLTHGESDDFDPTGLVRDGIIVVTVNYRLGALGFLATSSLAARQDGHSGNYGLMDQQAALRWVHRDIRHFGGDPHNVTIAGESAGGLSVLSQLASPRAHGLFDKAIVESGTYASNQPSLAQAEQSGGAFAAAVGCAHGRAACLREVPVSTILTHQKSRYRPIIDGRVLTQPLETAFATGRFNRVPVINGSNHDEWRLIVAATNVLAGNPVTPANYRKQFGVTPAAADLIAHEYPLSDYASPALAVAAVGTDAVYACTALATDRMLSEYVPTYAYSFDDRHAPEVFLPPAPGFPYGAAHASELQYLFGLNSVAYPATLAPAQQRLARTMRGYWAHFAKTGVPAGFTTPHWPRFAAATHRTQSLVPPDPRTETDFAAEHHCGFWISLGR